MNRNKTRKSGNKLFDLLGGCSFPSRPFTSPDTNVEFPREVFRKLATAVIVRTLRDISWEGMRGGGMDRPTKAEIRESKDFCLRTLDASNPWASLPFWAFAAGQDANEIRRLIIEKTPLQLRHLLSMRSVSSASVLAA